MKLQGFFTPTEITNGLASIHRVEELVSLMQQDDCHITVSAAEATQIWSSVARTVAETQNADCLRQFIKLGGVHYLDRWLQEAKNCYTDAFEKPVEQLMCMVLAVLLKLPMDQEGLKACGIGDTVRHLCSHKSMEIQGMAKALADAWENFTNIETESENMRSRISHNYEHSGCMVETTPMIEGGGHSNCERITTFDGIPAENCLKRDSCSYGPRYSSSILSSDGVDLACTNDSKDKFSTEGFSGSTSSRYDKFESGSLKEVTGDGSFMDIEVARHSLDKIVSTSEISGKGETALGNRQTSKPAESEESGIVERKNFLEITVEDSLKPVTVVAFNKQSKTVFCTSNPKTTTRPVSSPSDGCKAASHEAESCNNGKACKEMNVSMILGLKCSLEKHPAGKVTLKVAEDESLNHWKKIMEPKPEKQTYSCITPEGMQNASLPIVGKLENLGENSQDKETLIADEAGRMLYMKPSTLLNAEGKSTTPGGKICVPLQRLGHKNAECLNREGAEMELTYEPDDALKVARQVARQVEQDIVIYREDSVSSSSVEDRNHEPVFFSTAESREPMKNEFLTGNDNSSKSSGSEPDSPDSCCSNKAETGPEIAAASEQLHPEVEDLSHVCPTIPESDDGQHDQESSQLTTIPEDPTPNGRPHTCCFDLNEDIQTEEVDCSVQLAAVKVSPCHVTNLSTPIPVIATSRGPVNLRTTPLQFEGELGWKGSAATSAFRPASLCKIPEREKVSSTDDNIGSSKQSLSFRGIDLNITDGVDHSVVEVLPVRHVPASSTLFSDDSSAEVSLRQAERLNLDLNRLGDNDDNCPDLLSDWRTENRLHLQRNEAHSPSPRSSSKPSIRNFDLNDNPSFGEAHDVSRPVQDTGPSINKIPVVSILGSTMRVGSNNTPSVHWADAGFLQDFGHGHGRKEFLHSAHPFEAAVTNVAPSLEQMPGMISMQPSLACTPQPGFSYNGLMGPMIPVPSAVYPSGGIPYMVDSRGATILPPMLGSGSFSTFPRPPYFIDIAAPAGMNEISIFKSNLDLNAGVTSSEAESRGNVGHIFFPANNSLLDEQVKSFQQVTAPGPTMKRKEPDCGWDAYQVGYKQVTSWR